MKKRSGRISQMKKKSKINKCSKRNVDVKTGEAAKDSNPELLTSLLKYSCDDCGLEMPTYLPFVLHRNVHLKNACRTDSPEDVNVENCYYCKTFFRVEYDSCQRKMEIIKMDLPKMETHECEFCSIKFSDYAFLVDHYNAVHSDNTSSSIVMPNIKTDLELYRCLTCKKNYLGAESYQKHMLHHAEKLDCELCGKQFPHPKALRRHVQRHAAFSAKLFECNMCFKNFTKKKTLVAHRYLHAGEKPYKCELCDRSFSAAETLKSHLVYHEDTEDNPLKCEWCGIIYSSGSSLRTHIQRKHVNCKILMVFTCDLCEMKFKKKQDLEQHLERTPHIVDNTFKCVDCSKMFPYKSILDYHRFTHSGVNVLTCIFCFRKYPRLQSYLHHITNFHKCDICPQGFRYKDDVDAHIKEHLNETKHVCVYCEKICETSKDLIDHVKLHNFQCAICNKIFMKEYTFSIHRFQHFPEKKFNCTKCLSRFDRPQCLNNHLKHAHGEIEYNAENNIDSSNTINSSINKELNTNEPEHIFLPEENVYRCKFCTKKYQNLMQVKNHIIDDHIKPLEDICEFCNKTFTKLSDLHKHKREVHLKPDVKHFKCDLCEKAFFKIHALRYHKQNHSGEKPFSCPTCEKNFARPYLLKRHIEQMHTPDDMKTFKCNFCPKGFWARYDLEQHVKTHNSVSKKHIGDILNSFL